MIGVNLCAIYTVEFTFTFFCSNRLLVKHETQFSCEDIFTFFTMLFNVSVYFCFMTYPSSGGNTVRSTTKLERSYLKDQGTVAMWLRERFTRRPAPNYSE